MTSEHWKVLLGKGVPGLTPGTIEEVGGSAPVSAEVFNTKGAQKAKILDLSLAWDSCFLDVCAAADGRNLLWVKPVNDGSKEFQSKLSGLRSVLPDLFESKQEIVDLEEGDFFDDDIKGLGELSITCRSVIDASSQSAAVWLGFQADSSVIVFFNPGNPTDHSYSDSEGNSDFEESSYCDEFLEDLED